MDLFSTCNFYSSTPSGNMLPPEICDGLRIEAGVLVHLWNQIYFDVLLEVLGFSGFGLELCSFNAILVFYRIRKYFGSKR